MKEQEFISFFNKKYRHTSSFLSGFTLLFVDSAALFLTIGISFFIVNAVNPLAINFRSFVTYTIYFPLILIVFYASGLYPGIMISPAEEIKKIAISMIFSFTGIAFSILLENKEGKIAIIIALLIAIPISIFTIPTAREAARRGFGHFGWWGVPAVIYCTGDSGNTVINRLLKRPDLGNKPAVIINSAAIDCYEYNDIPVFPPTKNILEIIKKLHIKVAILCDFGRNFPDSMMNFRYVVTIPRNQNLFAGTMQLKDFAGILGFSSTHNLTKKINLVFRRFTEILFLLVLSPFVLVLTVFIAVFIKISSPGPIFYGHERIGKNREKIKCWKFRSMYIDADEQLQKILDADPQKREEWERDRKFSDDPRITPFGKFLRKTSLDELPQFWNVILGQMSLVGPRPVTESELIRYGDNIDFILSVPPGISGMWQVSGRSDTGYEERITLDTYYIQNWSIWLDLWIVIKTIWVVFSGKGAY